MATKDELVTQAGWAQEIRVASTWITGARSRKLLDLANRIDPEVASADEAVEANDLTPESDTEF